VYRFAPSLTATALTYAWAKPEGDGEGGLEGVVLCDPLWNSKTYFCGLAMSPAHANGNSSTMINWPRCHWWQLKARSCRRRQRKF
jgi:hypothetical protein